jgi:hypothetical protein
MPTKSSYEAVEICSWSLEGTTELCGDPATHVILWRAGGELPVCGVHGIATLNKYAHIVDAFEPIE